MAHFLRHAGRSSGGRNPAEKQYTRHAHAPSPSAPAQPPPPLAEWVARLDDQLLQLSQYLQRGLMSQQALHGSLTTVQGEIMDNMRFLVAVLRDIRDALEGIHAVLVARNALPTSGISLPS